MTMVRLLWGKLLKVIGERRIGVVDLDKRLFWGIFAVVLLVIPRRGEPEGSDLTVTVNRADLNQVMMGVATFDDLITAGKAKFDGNRTGFDQLRSILVPFTPDFEILPGTVPKAPSAAARGT
jgi:alkyl sulfatase BDS1-like metallo-beta-lactamase superfamily hydrolase